MTHDPRTHATAARPAASVEAQRPQARSQGHRQHGRLDPRHGLDSATLLALFASLCSGYVYARFTSRALDASAFGVIVVRMMPPIVVTVPLFPVVNALALNDTHLLLVLLYAAFYVSLGTYIMRAFIAQPARASARPCWCARWAARGSWSTRSTTPGHVR